MSLYCFISNDETLIPIPQKWMRFAPMRAIFRFESASSASVPRVKLVHESKCVHYDAHTIAIQLAFGTLPSDLTQDEATYINIVQEYGIEALIFADQMSAGRADCRLLARKVVSQIGSISELLDVRDTRCTYLMRETEPSMLCGHSFADKQLNTIAHHPPDTWARIGDLSLLKRLLESYDLLLFAQDEESVIEGSKGNIDYYQAFSQHTVSQLRKDPLLEFNREAYRNLSVALTQPNMELGRWLLSLSPAPFVAFTLAWNHHEWEQLARFYCEFDLDVEAFDRLGNTKEYSSKADKIRRERTIERDFLFKAFVNGYGQNFWASMSGELNYLHDQYRKHIANKNRTAK